jgi:hypothetical protein
MTNTSYPTIQIHAGAPDKPVPGAPCNGCGVCCMVEPCPVSALLLAHKENTCPALVWQNDTKLYRCGMLISPARYCRWLPARLNRPIIFLVRRWLAIATGCDCSIEVESEPG